MSESIKHKQFPEFFTTKGPIQTNVLPLKVNDHVYWMSLIVNDDSEHSLELNILRPYEDNEEGLLDCCDVEENYDIFLTKSGKFKTSFYVPSSLLSYIIGPKGVKLKNLQRNTNTLIKVPKPNENGDIKITGDTERSVASARTQIMIIVMQRKDKLPISHFVSISVNSDDIKEKFILFQKQILEQAPRGVTSTIFQKPEKLHLTICTLTLVDELEVIAAKKVLQSCYDDFISNNFERNKKHLLIVQGLEIMNDDPSEVNVLYCNVHMNNSEQNKKLQETVDKISEYFYKAGLAKKQYDRIKLHITLLNTSFRNAEEKRGTFDATYILKEFRNYYFGTVHFNKLQLSVRFTTGDDQYYESALSIEI